MRGDVLTGATTEAFTLFMVRMSSSLLIETNFDYSTLYIAVDLRQATGSKFPSKCISQFSRKRDVQCTYLRGVEKRRGVTKGSAQGVDSMNC